jgi:hypothetical protein
MVRPKSKTNQWGDWRMAAIAWQEEGTIDVGHVWQRTGVRAVNSSPGASVAG